MGIIQPPGVTRADFLSSKGSGFGPRFCLLGDSRGDQATETLAETANARSAWSVRGFATWLRWLTGQRIVLRHQDVFALSGATASGVLATQVPLAIAGKYDWAILIVGTNDVYNLTNTTDPTQHTSTAACIADYLAICKALTAAGMKVVVLPITPRSAAGQPGNWGSVTTDPTLRITVSDGRKADVASINGWRQQLAATMRGIYFADPRPALMDPSTSDVRTGKLFDGLHFAPPGASDVSAAIAAIINPLIPPLSQLISDGLDKWDASYRPNGSMVTNPFMTGTGGTIVAPATGVVPDGYTTASSAGTIASGTAVWSKETSTDGLGEWAVLTLTNLKGSSNLARFTLLQSINRVTGINTGDVQRAMCEVMVVAGNVGLLSAGLNAIERGDETDISYVDGWPYLTYAYPTNALQYTSQPEDFTLRGVGSIGNRVQPNCTVYVDTTLTNGASAVVKFRRLSLRKVG